MKKSEFDWKANANIELTFFFLMKLSLPKSSKKVYITNRN
jgi:hypothetical protein